MFNLIPISLLIMALAGVIFIVSNHLSEFSAKGGSTSGGEDESSFGIKAKLAGWINQLPLDNVKAQSLSWTQKLLHRMRIILLKTDNHLMKLISKISKKDKAASTDFWKDFSSDNQKVSQKQISEPKPEAKVDLAFKLNSETEKFFDPVRNGAKKVDGILTNQVSNGVDIKPVKKVSKPKRQRK